MARLYLLLAALVLISSSQPEALAQDRSTINAFNDIARAQQRQAESLRRIETIQRDAARADDRARRNAERDSRSMRRFDG